jgi:hypothetical protein
MPRSSNSKSSDKKQSIPPPRRAPSPAPSPTPAPIPSYTNTPSQPPSMLDSMKQGFGFGIGSAIAHNLFRTNNKEETPKKNEITNEPKLTNDKIYELYNKCLEKNDKNIDCTTILQNNEKQIR